MTLYYDTISQTYSLKTDEGSKFLGPFVNAMLILQDCGLNEKQAREAAMRAMMGRGLPIHLASIRNIAALAD